MNNNKNPIQTASIVSNKQHVLLSAFSHSVTEKLGLPCSIDTDFDKKASSHLILIDVTSMGVELCFEILRSSDSVSPTPACILYNVPVEIAAIKLIEWPHVVGAFTADDHSDMILELLPDLLTKHIWVSTPLANQLLKHIRRKPRQTHIPLKHIKLTRREIQILGHLKDGHTNQAIADMIFVSEHTIKSHLYTTYRKIGVGTRLEASNWVMDNLELFEDS